MANRTFYDTFRLPREETEGRRFPELSNSGWDFTALRDRLYEAFQENREFDPLGIEAELPRSGHRSFLAAGRLIDLGADQRRALLLALSDVTEQKLAESQMQSARSTLEKNLRDTESSLRESEADLRRSREELRDLAARLLTTQEAERRRVSRELHDDLNQKLAMLEMDADRLGAQIAPTPEIGRELQSLRNRVADLSNDIRRVAYELHPSILEHLGLGVALRSYCNEFSKREGIKVKFSVKDQPESVPDDVALCLYRITQEGLRNVGKHASAKSASVALEMCGSRLHLCIRDNGGGFEPGAKHKGGIGLLSMKERVRLVDGEFMLQSNLGKGTRLDVWAPLSKGPE